MTRARGIVVQTVGGYHTVAFPDGRTSLLVARGILKRSGAILPGDYVEVDEEEGVIETVLPRRSELARPPVANVDMVIVVASLSDPSPSFELIDRTFALAERLGLEAALVLNKVDLVGHEEAKRAAAPYEAAGYPTLITSARSSRGIQQLAEVVGQRVAVVAGPSGVGKSSLINHFVESASQATGTVSEKTRRGRHTTRAVTLLPLKGGGWIADAPGFSSLSLGPVDPREAPRWYPEFRSLESQCRFAGCMHRSEPACQVRTAAEDGRIDRGRYERYLRILSEIEEAFERRY